MPLVELLLWLKASLFCATCCVRRICAHILITLLGGVILSPDDVQCLRRHTSDALRSPWSPSSPSSASSSDGEEGDATDVPDRRPPARPPFSLTFAEGGIFFWWQLGVANALHQQAENRCGIPCASFTGASAGAIAAVAMACGLHPEKALAKGQQLAVDNGEYNRPFPLLCTWGPLIRQWLETLLPEDAAERCSGRVGLIINPLPNLHPIRVTSFTSREDLIDCCMAAVHLPWVLDGQPYARFREHRCIDFAIFTHWRHVHATDNIVVHTDDTQLASKFATDRLAFLRLLSPTALLDLIALGRRFGEQMGRP